MVRGEVPDKIDNAIARTVIWLYLVSHKVDTATLWRFIVLFLLNSIRRLILYGRDMTIGNLLRKEDAYEANYNYYRE
jgi:hypothetical protein